MAAAGWLQAIGSFLADVGLTKPPGTFISKQDSGSLAAECSVQLFSESGAKPPADAGSPGSHRWTGGLNISVWLGSSSGGKSSSSAKGTSSCSTCSTQPCCLAAGDSRPQQQRQLASSPPLKALPPAPAAMTAAAAAAAAAAAVAPSDALQVQRFWRSATVDWHNLAALLTVGKLQQQPALLNAACSFLRAKSAQLNPDASSQQFAWRWIVLADAAGCSATACALIDAVLRRSKGFASSCSTAIMQQLSTASQEHLGAVLAEIQSISRGVTARSSSNSRRKMQP